MRFQKLIEKKLFIFGVAIASLLFDPLKATAQQISAVLDCSAAQPTASPAINYPILFTRTGSKLLAAQATIGQAGQETLHGSVEPNGIVRMFGMGRFTDGSSS